jgi:glycosyltransferase involved in cell wall biosynthesis
MEHSSIQKPLVTIIIPTFNRAYILPRAIESILNQTMKDWELLIIDDGSTDNTEKLIVTFQEKSKNIIYIKQPFNKGVTAARNVALSRARGIYIAFLDSDDVWMPEKLQKQTAILDSKPEVGLVYTGAIFVNDRTGEKRIKHTTVEGDIHAQEIIDNPIGSPSRVILRKEVFSTVGLFDEQFSNLEDWEMWIRITRKYSVAAINKPLINYTESDDSMSINPQKLIEGYKKLWDKYPVETSTPVVRSAHYLRLGHRLCYYGSSKEGRFYIKKALQIKPSIKNMGMYIVSLLPLKIYQLVTFYAMKSFQ